MKLLLLIIICIAFLTARSQPFSIAAQIASDNDDRINCVKICSDQSIVISGCSSGPLRLNNYQLRSVGSGFIAKYTPQGTPLWMIPCGENENGFTFYTEFRNPSIALGDSDYIFALGIFNDTAFVSDTYITDSGSRNALLAKIDGSGNVVWLKKLTSDAHPLGICTDRDNNIIVTGYVYHSTYFDDTLLHAFTNVDYTMFIAKYTTSGRLLWAVPAGGDFGYGCEAYSVSTDNVGDIYLAGHARVDTARFGSSVLPTHYPYTLAAADGFVAKYSANGNGLWAKYCGYENFSVAADPLGGCYTGGYSQSSGYFDTMLVHTNISGTTMFLAHYSSTGAFDWVRFNQENNIISNTLSVAADAHGNGYANGSYHVTFRLTGTDSVVLASYLCDTLSPVSNTFIIAVNRQGDLLWSKSGLSCRGSSNGEGLDVRGCTIAACGLLYGPGVVYFDNDSMPVASPSDGYFVTLENCLVNTDLPQTTTENKPVLSFYPNPANELGILQFTNNYDSKGIIQIISPDGKIQIEQPVQAVIGDNKFHIPLARLAGGFYILRVTTATQDLNLKFVKE